MSAKYNAKHPPKSTSNPPESFSDLNAGQRIKAARLALGMSQSEFAKALGLSRKQTVSNWECGVKTPRPYVWGAIEQLRVK